MERERVAVAAHTEEMPRGCPLSAKGAYALCAIKGVAVQILLAMALAAGVVPVTPIDQKSWIVAADYPSHPLFKSQQGDTDFRLTVSAVGEPIRCDIEQSSGSAEIDANGCRLLMKRARFKPALDSAGQQVLGIFRNRIRWYISIKDQPVRHARADVLLWVKNLPPGVSSPAQIGVILVVDAAGNVEACRATYSEIPKTLADAACQQAKTLLKPTAAKDERGVAMRSVQNADIVFAVEGLARTEVNRR
jgi:hypothetical protein